MWKNDIKIIIFEKLSISDFTECKGRDLKDLRCYKITSFTITYFGNGEHKLLFQFITETIFENSISHELAILRFPQVGGVKHVCRKAGAGTNNT